jgi:hypothetical protein
MKTRIYLRLSSPSELAEDGIKMLLDSKMFSTRMY